MAVPAAFALPEEVTVDVVDEHLHALVVVVVVVVAVVVVVMVVVVVVVKAMKSDDG